MPITPSPASSRLEWLAVSAIAGVGLALRLWPIGQLGLSHFDEGIYAMAGSWSLDPRGLWALDPALIPYAPPGFPLLVGLSYAVLGRSDVAAIAVSQSTGTLAIAAVAWLARRSFGPGSGFAAATLAALSGPHIAFSRMALTDASFLLAWLIAIGLGMRFLERRTVLRGVAMGLAVGLAQQFKYNGWLAGGLVILSALIGSGTHAEERRPGILLRTIGWGGMGAAIAWLVVLPWYRFVEDHGGYAALLGHQRSYLGGFASWLPHFRSQADQALALSSGRTMQGAAWVLAGVGGALIRRGASPGERSRSWSSVAGPTLALVAAGGVVFAIIPNAAWWIGLLIAPGLIVSGRPSHRMVGAWWLVLSILTPFYHPYARLWLPIHAAGWVILGGMLGPGVEAIAPFLRRFRGEARIGDPGGFRTGLAGAWVLAVGALWSVELVRDVEPARALPGLLARSDLLRDAARDLVARFPKEAGVLLVYGRPSLTFYLAGRIPIAVQAGPERINRGGDGRSWALIDQGLDGSQAWVDLSRWEPVGEFPTRLPLPTLLDVEPRFATGRNALLLTGTQTLVLLRPRNPRGLP